MKLWHGLEQDYRTDCVKILPCRSISWWKRDQFVNILCDQELRINDFNNPTFHNWKLEMIINCKNVKNESILPKQTGGGRQGM